MKNKLYILSFLSFIFSQEEIGEGLYTNNLIEYLQQNYTTNTVLGYDAARDIMYGQIYNNNGNVSCIYTDFTVENVPTTNPRPIVHNGGLDCEHVWPQSMYEGSSPMKSDSWPGITKSSFTAFCLHAFPAS